MNIYQFEVKVCAKSVRHGFLINYGRESNIDSYILAHTHILMSITTEHLYTFI